jgi:uncharacterized protein (TIGR02145 family)
MMGAISCEDDAEDLIPTNIENVTDIDGNVYKTVKIGNQLWMVENLKVTHYRNGDPINHVTDMSEWPSGASYSNYDNDTTNGSTYGRLYNWYAVDDSRNIAPEGWHVATDEDWNELEMFLGSDAGGKLKATGTIEGGDGLWYEPNEGATNESGFSALPGGLIRIAYGAIFDGLGEAAVFWTSTGSVGPTGSAWVRSLADNSSAVLRSSNSPLS